MTSGYDRDLAWVHDVGYGDFARGSAPWLIRQLRRRRLEGRVVELGCGSGLLARALTGAGFEVLGIDQSPAMLRLARKRAPRATFRQGSFVSAGIPRCVAVVALGEVFNYLFDPKNTLRTLTAVFQRAAAALEPGGVLVFDVAVPGRGGAPGSQAHRLSADWAVLVERWEDARGRTLERRITTFRRAGADFQRSDEVHRLVLYPPREIAAALRRSGFTVRRFVGEGRWRLGNGVVGFLATRRRGVR